jgi:hypothetical protein
MAIRRTDIEIILPGVTYQEKMAIPVWDAYIEKVVIDGDIPSLIPEFNFDFLDGNRNIKAYESYERGDLPLRDIYWWERNDKESRIKAFDKLIGIYEAKVNGRAL